MQPNLTASFEGDPFDPIIVGGDKKNSPIVIANTGGGWAVGNVDVKVYLSKIGGGDASGVIVDPNTDLLIGSLDDVALDLAGGSTVTLMASLQIPRQLVTTSGEVYRLLAQVTPSDTAIAERFSDDNVSFDSKVHDWENGFGTFSIAGFGKRTNAVLTYAEADGDVVSFTLSKGSGGRVTFDGTLADLAVLTAKQDAVLTAKVVTAVSTAKGDIDIENVELFRFMDSVNLSKVTLSGSFSAAEGVRDLQLGNVSGGGLMSIGRFPIDEPGKPSLTFKRVADFGIDSLTRIKSIRAVEWLDTDGATNAIRALSIGSLVITGRAGDAIRGDFEANVSLSAPKGLGVLSVAGFVKDANIVVAGDVDSVDVGGFDHANLFVGVTSRVADAGGFALPQTLGSFTVHGVKGSAASFIDSNVVAASIGSVFVKGLDADSGDGAFGFVADAIKSYNRGNVVTAMDLATPQKFDRQGNYSVKIV